MILNSNRVSGYWSWDPFVGVLSKIGSTRALGLAGTERKSDPAGGARGEVIKRVSFSYCHNRSE